jgi:tryptophan synthase alpha chain
MNRISQRFQELRQSKRKALVSYIVAGDPDLNTTLDIVLALERSGSDLIELGIPFSDPLADGVVNQLGAQRALEAGTTLSGIFNLIRELRKKTSIPLVLFTYFNPVFSYGVERFFQTAESAGVDGILILDLPPEESVRELLGSTSLSSISLIAPTTPPARMQQIVQKSSGFIYYVSRAGVTGMQSTLPPNISEPLQLIKQHTELPICVGFGISNPDQARYVAQFADGVVVGSAIVNLIAQKGKSPDLIPQIENVVRPLAQAIHQS